MLHSWLQSFRFLFQERYLLQTMITLRFSFVSVSTPFSVSGVSYQEPIYFARLCHDARDDPSMRTLISPPAHGLDSPSTCLLGLGSNPRVTVFAENTVLGGFCASIFLRQLSTYSQRLRPHCSAIAILFLQVAS
jgi:hypothetical protein